MFDQCYFELNYHTGTTYTIVFGVAGVSGVQNCEMRNCIISDSTTYYVQVANGTRVRVINNWGGGSTTFVRTESGASGTILVGNRDSGMTQLSEAASGPTR